jgi:multiple sugar transport system permease protein
MAQQADTLDNPPRVTRRSGATRSMRRRYGLFLLLIAPVFIVRITTAALPILRTFQLSLTNTAVLKGTSDFVGFANYARMATDPGVQGALYFTIFYVVVSTLLDMVIGLAIAMLLNSAFAGRGFVRTLNLIPWAIPTIVAGYVFRWMLHDQFGIIPYLVFELTGYRIVAFTSVWGARTAVILVQVWKEACFMAIVFLAGLQGLPHEVFDAAKVDGASAWQRLWRITLPLIMPLAITMGLFRIVWSLANFDLIYGLTMGGPGSATMVLALRIFQEGILFFNFGFASAISVLLLAVVAVLGVIALFLFRRTDVSA